MSNDRERANKAAVEGLLASDPVLVGIESAGRAMGLPRSTVLTSGPAMPFSSYTGGQRAAVIGGALYEGLAADESAAVAAFERGEITVRGCQEFGCVGSLAGVTTASMPVVVVADDRTGERAYCTLYEGDSADRLNYGSYTEATKTNLEDLRLRIAPALNTLIEAQSEAMRLRPIMSRALTMGDELHSRNAAATLLFLRRLLIGAKQVGDELGTALESLCDDYFFLRLSMAASKVMANAMRGHAGSSVVTAMAFSCAEFGIQTSGTGDTWFTGPLPTFDDYRLEPGYDADDIEFMGGESTITEVVGLGGLAQAAGLPLHRSSGRDASLMIARTTSMYEVTVTESPDFLIPVLNYRGTPLGLDVEKIVARPDRTPILDIGIAGRSGRQIGGGVARAPLAPFSKAWNALN
ncbi:DUF1116 domain-containing protein [Mycolicibacterium fortuitum]|uniref:YahG/YlbE-like protein n=1 Tax=Mycolicibacterium fortuitum subsp. fortuitum DSM 46621 = ATCC 6841 = JCM 6387 TaxID=1214102 RepID=K0VVW7_MYCFO|nr:DUF1116 domain-containing protein [Mycolicibacterium fortuitum]EJZ15569.1 hypothetical protein MFORT_03626 [Mycolicibacterium fortuitum subsp. fortuitum DSM 46621 = ATCC 6841 = JCM 6387]WEV33271.1 DUF1116 domain-containing protein [Mycolicibacterium fortuitum]CRL56691.1 hypothetical protein CPGR_04015 [Mycolicibacterium fortuitum subsp. fortuitum DSM 46621 = ATCC 6841 = JCM 6387]CRL80664.1 hypothetical protein CPGR_03871 [Mycolicibacter nonchromogenicus]